MFRWLSPLRLAAVLVALSFVSAEAVMLYRTGDASANTTAPDTQFPHDGWDYEGIWGGFLGTPIAPHFFISAAHIGQAGGSTFTFQNVNYTVLQGFYDPSSDLVIWRVAETFPTFAPLYSKQDEIGRRTVDIGRGTLRGDPYFLNSQMRGWRWGAQDGAERWGENIFESIYSNGPNDDLLRAAFDQNGLANECTLSSGDSGGAAFIDDSGTWKLAGINYGVDGNFYTDANGGGEFIAALYDMRGLYLQNDNPPPAYVQVTGANAVPAGFYPTRISTKLAWIAGVIATPLVGRENNFLTLTYTKVNVPELSYTVEQSPDLLGWTSASTIDETISTSGSTAIVKSKVDITGLSALFLRVRATQQKPPRLGSGGAHAPPRADFGASPKRFFLFSKKVVGEAPTTAREARALPGRAAWRGITSGRGSDRIGNAAGRFARSCVCLGNQCCCERPAPTLACPDRYLPNGVPDSRRRYIRRARK
jgi:hypothetical protein